MERHLIAYLLLASMALAVAAWLWFRHRYSPERSYRRRTKLESAAHARLMGERAGD